MKRYKPAKVPVLLTMVLVAALFYVLYRALGYIDEYIPFPARYLQLPAEIVGAVVSLLLLPIYYFNTFYTVSSKVVTARTGIIVTAKQLMPVSSVKSVTTIQVPFGNILGYNFVILNAQGTNLIIPFILKKDAKEIADIVNNSIRNRASSGKTEKEAP